MSYSCFSFKLPELSSLRRGNSRTSLQRQSPDNPYCIVIDFSSVTEKECGKLDAINEKKYNKLITKANKAEKTIHKTGLSMNLEVPPPPHPSNRDCFIIWKKRNVSRKVIPQSEAVLFLTQNNYTLNVDYEAYQAIDLANEIKKEKGLPIHANDKTHNFDNVYNHHDKNILRRRSMYRANKFPRPEEVQQPPSYQNTHMPSENRMNQQPAPLPPPPSPHSVNLRRVNTPIPPINSGFYPPLPVEQNNAPPSAPPSAPPFSEVVGNKSQNNYPQKNNVRFSVSCSGHDFDSDASF